MQDSAADQTARSTSSSASGLLSGQRVLVTGGARGLGLELSRAFVREGAQVVVNYRNSAAAAHRLVTELTAERTDAAIAIQADVTDPVQVDDLFTAAENSLRAPVTVVVNNALAAFAFDGDARPKAHEVGWDRFAQQFDGSVKAALNTVQRALPGFARAGSGRVINIGTNLFQHPVVPYHDYTAAKAALLSLTRTLAHDLGPDGITVNMVSGGLLRATDASAATPTAVFDTIAQGTPLRRVTTPAEFADAVMFFASPWSRSVTGQNLVVDGGLVMD